MNIKKSIFITILTLCAPLLSIAESNISSECGGNLDISSKLLPSPESSKFIDSDYYIWCGSTIKGEDGLWHMFYSRWPRKFHHNGWVTHSEVAHATSKTPFGKWTFADVALPERGTCFWDGLCTHNPVIKKFAGKYYLYYMGNTGNSVNRDPSNPETFTMHRNNQRVGVAVSDSLSGPWTRLDKPIIDVSADSKAPDALCTTNPAILETPDGKYLMVYKGVAKINPLPKGGPVVHLTATSDSPTGPFKKQLVPIFTAKGSNFPAEDPYIWYVKNDGYYALAKDMNGSFIKNPKGAKVVLFYSKNGMDWSSAKHPLVTLRQITWESGEIQKLLHLERPQGIFDGDKLIGIQFACDVDREHSFNAAIPIKSEE